MIRSVTPFLRHASTRSPIMCFPRFNFSAFGITNFNSLKKKERIRIIVFVFYFCNPHSLFSKMIVQLCLHSKRKKEKKKKEKNQKRRKRKRKCDIMNILWRIVLTLERVHEKLWAWLWDRKFHRVHIHHQENLDIIQFSTNQKKVKVSPQIQHHHHHHHHH
jgi:hypothetical protein